MERLFAQSDNLTHGLIWPVNRSLGWVLTLTLMRSSTFWQTWLETPESRRTGCDWLKTAEGQIATSLHGWSISLV